MLAVEVVVLSGVKYIDYIGKYKDNLDPIFNLAASKTMLLKEQCFKRILVAVIINSIPYTIYNAVILGVIGPVIIQSGIENQHDSLCHGCL